MLIWRVGDRYSLGTVAIPLESAGYFVFFVS